MRSVEARVVSVYVHREYREYYVHMDTYWKSPQYVIRPRERLTPVVMIDVQKVEHVHIREYTGGRAMVLGPEYGVIHHLSYAGPDERPAIGLSRVASGHGLGTAKG